MNIPTHHRLYAGIFAVLGSLAVYFFIQAERATIRLQDQAARTIRDTPAQLIAAVHIEGDATRRLVGDQLAGIRVDVVMQTSAALSRVDAAMAAATQTEADANWQITQARKDIFDLGTMADDRLAGIQKDVTGQLASVTKPAASVLSQVDDALPYILDCDPSHAGADCLPNKYLEMTSETQSALFAISKATPQMVAAANGIAADVHAVADDGVKAADKFVAPPTRWEKIRAIITGALVVLVKAGL